MLGLIRKLLVVFVVLLILSAFLIIRDNDLDLTNKEDALFLGKAIFGWTGQVVKNVAGITGYAVGLARYTSKLDWFPQN